MRSRRFLQEQYIKPTELVSMVLEILPKLELIDINRLILLSELEIQYRDDHDLLSTGEQND